MNFSDIEFSEPKHVFTNSGKRYMRKWVLPDDEVILKGFKKFWRQRKLKMMGKGFAFVKNKRGKWELQEWKDNLDDYIDYANRPVIELVSDLKPKKLKYTGGLRPWQIPATEYLVESIRKHNAAMDGSDTGVGKCHPKGTMIKMFSGIDKAVEDIQRGDQLMGDDSTPRTVLSTSIGFGKLFRIKPISGESWCCNEHHILVLKNTRTRKIKEFSVKEYMINRKRSSRFHHEWKLIRTGVDYVEKELPIDPYFVGLWIGDGLWMRPGITIGDNDPETVKYLYELADRRGMDVNIQGDNVKTYFITKPKKLQYNHLLDGLRELGFIKSKEKFIPNIIKYNCREIRLQCLAGLIDSDGWKDNNGNYGFSTKYEKLADDFTELVRSLGFFAKKEGGELKEYKIGKYEFTGRYWRVKTRGIYDIPTKLPRKQSNGNTSNKSCLVSGFDVEYIGDGDYFGFTLDGNHRYLLKDFTITHNTYSAVATARELGLKVAVICPKSVIESWRRVIVNHFKLSCRFVLNYEALKTPKYHNIVRKVRPNKLSAIEEFKWVIPKDTLIIFDESHRLKGIDTLNSKLAKAAKRQGYKILCCSATNAIDPTELDAVGYILGLHKSGQYFTKFLKEHGCKKGSYGIAFNNDKYFLRKLHKDIFLDRGVRLKKEELPDFPESEIIAEPYSLDDESTHQINKIYEEMNMELEQLKKVQSKDKGDTKLTIRLRARQRVELLKVPLFVEMANDLLDSGHSVVIIVNFTQTIQALSRKLNTNCIVSGDNKKNERQKNMDAFQADDERVIIINIQAGGVGVSLQDLNGNHSRVALISPNDSAPLLRQSFGRIHRDGAKTKSQQRVIFVANTVEEEVCNNVKMKLNNLDLINDGDLNPKYEGKLKE